MMPRPSLLLAALLPLLTACETVLTDYEAPAARPLLVVEGGIERRPDADSLVQRIVLSTTRAFVGPNAAPPAVETATVTVSDGITTFPFLHEGGGVYVCRGLAGRVGTTYTLRLTWDGATYTATETLLPVPAIERVYTEFVPGGAFSDDGVYVKLDTQDPANAPNHYLWRLFIDGELQMNPDPGNSREVIASDEFFDGQPLRGLTPNGEIAVVPGDTVRVEQVAISKRRYDYLFAIFNLTASTPLFGDPPPANPPGNIRNEQPGGPAALGYFGAAEVSVAGLIVP